MVVNNINLRGRVSYTTYSLKTGGPILMILNFLQMSLS